MTTIINVPNIYNENEIYYPDELRANSDRHPAIKAISFVAKRNTAELPLYDALKECAATMLENVKNYSMMALFCSQNTWVDNTAVARAKGLWKWNKVYQDLSQKALAVGPDLKIENGSKIRFYGMALLSFSDSIIGLEIIRTQFSCFGILCNNRNLLADGNIERCYKAAFPDGTETSINWVSVIESLKEDVIVRATGFADDLESSIDLFNV